MHAVQYYMAGRFSAVCEFVPVCMLLFHHAIEMLLKAEILERHPHKDDVAAMVDIRKRFGHHLVTLWNEVKSYHPNASLADFDQSVATLNEFEDVRYPEPRVFTMAGFSFAKFDGPPFSVKDIPRARNIFLSLEEVDALMTRLWEVFGLSLNLLQWSASEASPIVHGFYTMYNRTPAYPPQVVISYRIYDVESFPPPPTEAKSE